MSVYIRYLFISITVSEWTNLPALSAIQKEQGGKNAFKCVTFGGRISLYLGELCHHITIFLILYAPSTEIWMLRKYKYM